jgi:hypothetical protein
VERQAELGQPFLEVSQHLSRVGRVLEAHDEVVGIAHDRNPTARMPLTPLMDPEIEDVVQEDLGQAWADPLSVSCHSSLSRIPASSHIRTSRSTRGSAILCASIRSSHSWSTESKKPRISASSTQVVDFHRELTRGFH